MSPLWNTRTSISCLTTNLSQNLLMIKLIQIHELIYWSFLYHSNCLLYSPFFVGFKLTTDAFLLTVSEAELSGFLLLISEVDGLAPRRWVMGSGFGLDSDFWAPSRSATGSGFGRRGDSCAGLRSDLRGELPLLAVPELSMSESAKTRKSRSSGIILCQNGGGYDNTSQAQCIMYPFAFLMSLNLTFGWEIIEQILFSFSLAQVSD